MRARVAVLGLLAVVLALAGARRRLHDADRRGALRSRSPRPGLARPVVRHRRHGGAPYTAWSYAFSHEILEMLVDPGDDLYHAWPTGARQLLEVCDPVENYTYPIDGVSR